MEFNSLNIITFSEIVNKCVKFYKFILNTYLDLTIYFKNNLKIILFMCVFLTVLGLDCCVGFSLIAASRGYSIVGA